MKITKFEQSGLIIESDNGFRIAVDVGSMTPIEKLDGIAPIDVFVVSHIHGDHFTPSHIAKLSPKNIILSKECYNVLNPSDIGIPAGAKMMDEQMQPKISSNFIISQEGFVYENENIKISCFHVDHGPNISVPVDNYGFVIEIDGQKIYFAGDMFNPSGMDVSKESFDYVFLPVGGHYTFDPANAFAFAKQFGTIKTLVPMHDRGEQTPLTDFAEMAKADFNVKILD